jgi:hypothetical protein
MSDVVQDPPVLLVFPVEAVAGMRTGLALAIMLLRLPECSSGDRALAVSELLGVLGALTPGESCPECRGVLGHELGCSEMDACR